MSLKFELTPKIKFEIDKEALFAFEFFTFRDFQMVDEMESFLRFSSGKKKFLDVGALFGIFSLAFTKSGKGKHAHAIEPSPVPFETMVKNLDINPKLDITPHMLALGAKNGTTKMSFEWLHMVALPENVVVEHMVEAKTLTLDDFLKKEKFTPDIVKIDVEGAEFDVLFGGKNFFKKNRPLVFLETHTPWIKRLGKNVTDLTNIITSLGYKIYDLQGNILPDPEDLIESSPNKRVILSSHDLV